MLKESEAHFDPLLLKIFVGLVGIHPIGSLALLDTREVGIVCKPNLAPNGWIGPSDDRDP